MDFLRQTAPASIILLVLVVTVGCLVLRTLFGQQDKPKNRRDKK